MGRWIVRGLLALVVVAVAVGGVLWFAFTLPKPPEPIATSFTLKNVTLVNPLMERRAGATLAVHDGRVAINPARASANALVAYGGMFVLPGFIDMHSHLPGDNVLKLSQHYGLLHLAYGVTTIREVGDIDATAVPAGRALVASGAPFPNIVSCGPFVSKGEAVWPNTALIETPDQAPAVVEKIAAGGNRCIKAYEGLTADIIAALVAATNARGMHVLGHVPVGLTLEEANLPDVQHFFGVQLPATLRDKPAIARNTDWRGVDEARLAAVQAFILEHHTQNTPTLVTLEGTISYGDYPAAAARAAKVVPSFFGDIVWHPTTGLFRGVGPAQINDAADALKRKQAFAKRLSDAGAVLHLGTDVGLPFTAAGVSFRREMELFAEAGIAPEKILANATNVAGAVLGDGAGVVSDGGPADLLIFRADPTRDLAALDTLEAVVVRGRLYRKADLDAAVAASLAHYEAWPLRPLSRLAIERTVKDLVEKRQSAGH